MYQVKRSNVIDEYEGCVYCNEPKGSKYSCCSENHFEECTVVLVEFNGKTFEQVLPSEEIELID